MHRTALLIPFLGLFVGCGSETSGPSAPASDASGSDTETVVEDTGAGSETSASGATFDEVYSVLTGSCAGGYCHGSGQGGWTVTSSAATTYSELVDQTSSSCRGLKKVEPGQPEKSSLYLKVRGSFTGVCSGTKMPSGGPYLNATQLETVRSWIAAGAKP